MSKESKNLRTPDQGEIIHELEVVKNKAFERGDAATAIEAIRLQCIILGFIKE
ncbi:MAG: hypothetical protein AAF502_21090 [Bacteroidota bacterium]